MEDGTLKFLTAAPPRRCVRILVELSSGEWRKWVRPSACSYSAMSACSARYFLQHASSQPHRQFTIRPLKDEIKNPEHDEQTDQENDTDDPTQNLEHICLLCLL